MKTFLVMLATLAMLAACSTAEKGAVIGGAAIGGAVGDTGGAVAGGLIGAVGGYLIGKTIGFSKNTTNQIGRITIVPRMMLGSAQASPLSTSVRRSGVTPT
jgi:hypothetical protein